MIDLWAKFFFHDHFVIVIVNTLSLPIIVRQEI